MLVMNLLLCIKLPCQVPSTTSMSGPAIGITLGDLFNRPTETERLPLSDRTIAIYRKKMSWKNGDYSVLEAYNAVTEQLSHYKSQSRNGGLV